MTLRVRLLAFTPLVVLTLLTGTAAMAGLALEDDQPAAAAVARPTASPSPTPVPEETPTATPTRKPVTVQQARNQWDEAIDATAGDLSGKYDWNAWLRGVKDPIASESGVFGLDPLRTSFERVLTDPTSKTGKTYTVRMRRQGAETYMQMADWGPWDGCWLAVTPQLLQQATGLEEAADVLSVALPIPVVIALNSTVSYLHPATWFGDPYVEYQAEVTAMEGLQFLGVNAAHLIKYRDALLKAKVPIVVAIGVDEKAKGAAARGTDISSAIRRANLKLPSRLLKYIREVSASITFWGLGDPAYVTLPGARSILPDRATRNQTCLKSAPGL